MRNQEWLLPWWWTNYQTHNTFPVTFVNLGDMSPQAINWCKERGEVVTLSIAENYLTLKEEIDPSLVTTWDKMDNDVWERRRGWFKKPYALLETPYESTIWFDTDCQVRGSIASLFAACDCEVGVALALETSNIQKLDRERGFIQPEEKEYNGGVIVYKKNSPVIQTWAKETKNHSKIFIGDQYGISRIFFEQNLHPTLLSPIFNWRIDQGVRKDAVILHWVGTYKEQIKRHLLILKEAMFIDLTKFLTN